MHRAVLLRQGQSLWLWIPDHSWGCWIPPGFAWQSAGEPDRAAQSTSEEGCWRWMQRAWNCRDGLFECLN